MTIFNPDAAALTQDLMALYPDCFEEAANNSQIATFLQEKVRLVSPEEVSATNFDAAKAWIDGLHDNQITAFEEAGDYRLCVSYSL